MQQQPKVLGKQWFWSLIPYGEDSCAWIHVGSNIPSELMLIICCLLDSQQGLVIFDRESIKVMFSDGFF
jgi:hypothetical protein